MAIVQIVNNIIEGELLKSKESLLFQIQGAIDNLCLAREEYGDDTTDEEEAVLCELFCKAGVDEERVQEIYSIEDYLELLDEVAKK